MGLLAVGWTHCVSVSLA